MRKDIYKSKRTKRTEITSWVLISCYEFTDHGKETGADLLLGALGIY